MHGNNIDNKELYTLFSQVEVPGVTMSFMMISTGPVRTPKVHTNDRYEYLHVDMCADIWEETRHCHPLFLQNICHFSKKAL